MLKHLNSIITDGLKPRDSKYGGLPGNVGLLFASENKEYSYSVACMNARPWLHGQRHAQIFTTMSPRVLDSLMQSTAVVAIITLKDTEEAGFKFRYALPPNDALHEWITTKTLLPQKHFHKIELFHTGKLKLSDAGPLSVILPPFKESLQWTESP